MSTTAIILIIAILIAAAVAGWVLYREQRARALRARFGPEYTHAVREYGNEGRAQDALAARARRMEKIHIRSLTREDHERFVVRWHAVQRSFVDDPGGAIQEADSLVNEVMRSRGYPMADFNHRAEDISVDHPGVVQSFRAAHDIAYRHKRGQAGTEDLRQAMVHYRNLFEELLEDHLVEDRRVAR